MGVLADAQQVYTTSVSTVTSCTGEYAPSDCAYAPAIITMTVPAYTTVSAVSVPWRSGRLLRLVCW